MNSTEKNNDQAPGQNKEYRIIVNGKERTVTDHRISYEQLVALAFPGAGGNGKTIYTVTYRKGEDKKPEGTMVAGDAVTVKNGMIFNVTATDKS